MDEKKKRISTKFVMSRLDFTSNGEGNVEMGRSIHV